MYFVADGFSDCGRVREHNEDTFRIDSERGLFLAAREGKPIPAMPIRCRPLSSWPTIRFIRMPR